MIFLIFQIHSEVLLSGLKQTFKVTVNHISKSQEQFPRHFSIQIQPTVPTETQYGEQGWRSGESARLPPIWSGVDSGPVLYWVDFVVCSRLAPRFFLQALRFSFLRKKTTLQIPIDLKEGPSIVKASLLAQQFLCGPTTGSESGSLEDCTPIDSWRLQRCPRIALKVENMSDPDSELRRTKSKKRNEHRW